jgi:cyanophycin synthetase
MEPDWLPLVEAGWTRREDNTRLLKYFSQLVGQYPASARAQFELANALDFCGREEEAIPAYEESLRRGLCDEYQVYAKLQLASSLRNVGKSTESVKILRDLRKDFPDMPAVKMFLALALYSDGHPEAALKTLMEAALQHVHSQDMARYGSALQHYMEQLPMAHS